MKSSARNSRTLRRIWLPVLLGAMLCVDIGPWAGLASAQESGFVDEQLFEDLTEELFNDIAPMEVLDSTDVNRKDDAGNQIGRGRSFGIVESDLAAPSGPNPLAGVVDAMRSVQGRLDRRDLAIETRRVQSEIVSSFDDLIKKLKQQKQRHDSSDRMQSQSQRSQQSQTARQQSRQEQSPQEQSPTSPASGSLSEPQAGNGNSGRKPSGTATSSSPRDGDLLAPVVGATDSTSRDQLMQQAWGNLPPGVRQEMQSSRPEKFLPAYSSLIEAYYRKLAEQEDK